jgi:hypothetical protein
MKAGAVWRDSDTASTPVFPIFPLCEWLSLPVGSTSRSSPASALSLGPHRLRLALRLARQGEIDRALPLSRQHKLLALCHSSDRRLRDDAAVNGGGAALSRGSCVALAFVISIASAMHVYVEAPTIALGKRSPKLDLARASGGRRLPPQRPLCRGQFSSAGALATFARVANIGTACRQR